MTTDGLDQVPLRVLIVAADSVPRAIVARSVAQLGHEVSTCADGVQAWALLTGPELFDVVVSERHLPDTTAVELARRVRQLNTSRYLYFIFLSPHRESTRAADDVRSGADDSIFYPVDRSLLQARLIVAGRVMALHRRLYAQARTDPLTQTHNRLRFAEDVRPLLDRAGRYDEPFGVAICDIDNFKAFNDTYGHQAGDEALKAVAAGLVSASRSSDAVYRFGGEEFVVTFANQRLDACRLAADRLRRRVFDLEVVHSGNPPWGRITLSLGVSVYTKESAENVERVIAQADEALYRAKNFGRNCVVAHGDEHATRLGGDRVATGDALNVP